MNVRRQCLHVEQLDDRLMMAGDVSARVDGGTLVVVGDDASNQVEIVQTSDEQYSVIGLDGTTVDGELAFVANGVTKNVEITMKSGDDEVTISGNTDVAEKLKVNLGAGDDTLNVGQGITDSVVVRDDFVVSGGSGNDTVRVRRSAHVNGDAAFFMHQGDDAVNFLDEARLDGDLFAVTGGGADVVRILNNTKIDGDVSLRTGAGGDRVTVLNDAQIGGDTYIQSAAGDDDLEILNDVEFAGHLEIVAGNGADTLSVMNRVEIQGDLKLNGGIGNDEIRVEGSDSGINVSGKTRVMASGGSDYVLSTQASFAEDFHLGGRAGADELVICGNSFMTDVEIDGGTSVDSLMTDMAAGGVVSHLGLESVFACV